MEASTILQASAFHRSFLLHTGAQACRVDENLLAPDQATAFAHSLWLVSEVPQLMATDHREKAMRWLCFTQGALWRSGLVTIRILKDVMRPDGTVYDSRA